MLLEADDQNKFLMDWIVVLDPLSEPSQFNGSVSKQFKNNHSVNRMQGRPEILTYPSSSSCPEINSILSAVFVHVHGEQKGHFQQCHSLGQPDLT